MEVKIGSKGIGNNHPAYIVAEIGINHEGDPKLAKELVKKAAYCGVDAVKFQTFTAERLIDKGNRDFDFFKSLELAEDVYVDLFNYAQELNIDFLSTPFDREAVDFLDQLGVPAFKIASGDLTFFNLLEYVAKKGKPVLLSTGMANLEEINEAVRYIEITGNNQLILLHCVSNYPPALEDINLKAINNMKRNFPYPIGYSDHSQNIAVPLAAICQGAAIIEKHFTFDKNRPGADHSISADVKDMSQLVENIRIIEKAQGISKKHLTASEKGIIGLARRSIVSKRSIKEGTFLSEDMFVFLRPAKGIPANRIKDIVGKKVVRDIQSNEVLQWDMIA